MSFLSILAFKQCYWGKVWYNIGFTSALHSVIVYVSIMSEVYNCLKDVG